MLTVKQEKFVINVFKGMTQRDAYVDAYHPGYSIEAVDANASRLASNDKVLTRLAELQGEVVSVAVSTVRERKEKLSQIANGELRTPATPKEAIMAITELNKMDRVYVDMPVQDNRSITIIVSNEEAKLLTEGIKGFGIWHGRDKRD